MRGVFLLLLQTVIHGATANLGTSHWRKTVANDLRRTLKKEGLEMSELEAELWLKQCRDDEVEALEKMRAKGKFRKQVGRVSMRSCARFFGSDGYTVALEGLRDKKERPIVYSHGIPRGDETQIRAQTVYLQERLLASAKTADDVTSLMIINARPKSFRFPDRALRRGGINVISTYYPWASKGPTVFVALPPYIRQVISIVQPVFPPETFSRFSFVDNFSDPAPDIVTSDNLPSPWGGDARWDLRVYVPARCLKERTFCPPVRRQL